MLKPKAQGLGTDTPGVFFILTRSNSHYFTKIIPVFRTILYEPIYFFGIVLIIAELIF